MRVAHEPQQLPAVHEAWLPREHSLHRPRHGGRQLTALISAIVFFTTPALLWVFGARPAEIENRHLASFPSLGDGWAFFTSLPGWATDQLTFRSAAIDAADWISRTFFGETPPRDQAGTTETGPLPGSPPPTQTQGTDDQPTTSGPLDQAGYRQVIEGRDGWLYFGYDAEAKCSPVRMLSDTLERMNRLRTIIEASGRKFVWVVAPDKSTMVPENLPSSYPGRECHRAAEAPTWQQIDAAGAVDLRPALTQEARRVNRPVYPSNDTHWTDEGSLVMTRAAAEAVQPGITATWQSKQVGAYTVAADLPPLLGKKADKTNVLYDLRPDGIVDRAGQTIADIETPSYRFASPMSSTVNEKTLFYGDSFTKASSRYLAAGFANLTMLAYFTPKTSRDQAIGMFTNSDVIVLETVERSVSSGQLPFLTDEFLTALQAQLQASPR
ncbi:alginate O-acetyltransferase AlgX-related protein [Amycolatopsis methanolica]|uniref:AlgX/AlgJ SGNH hydrolase-like domain-containing protein n=1 Tax=Amycolatopsis methanolica 239 TaxID=1068978 RepID=A0A076N5Q9_AMYME|nr:hypothetical protein [Amycolatopsis methanolica]AIJ26626.1 hypothetical protein AMETH_6534 [Amycolatopsis methanolica 239]